MSDIASDQPAQEPARSALGTSLRADYAALQNDLEQAQELAAEFQRQLAGKSNEVGHFKSLLQRTQDDFNRLNSHIEELRTERHRLANEAMRAVAFESQLVVARAEIDRLKEQVRTLADSAGKRVEELSAANDEHQREIARLRAALDAVKARFAPQPAESTQVQRQIDDLTNTVKRLQSTLDTKPSRPRPRELGEEEFEPDVINLSFER